MAFSAYFGPRLAQNLGNVLDDLVGHAIEQRKQQKKSDLLMQLLQPRQAGITPGQAMQPMGVPGQAAAPMQQMQGGMPQLSAAQLLALGQAGVLTPQEIALLQRDTYQSQKLQQQREALEQQRSLSEEKGEVGQSRDYINSLRKRLEPAQDLYETIKETQDLLNSPNLQIGPIKSLLPSKLQNTETQQLVAKLNEIVTKKAQLGRGVPSKQRLILEQLSKPQIWQKPETIKKLISNLEDQLSKTLKEGAIKDQIVEEYGKTPSGLEMLVKKRMKLMEQLPEPSEFSEDAIIKVNGKQYERSGNFWKPVGK